MACKLTEEQFRKIRLVASTGLNGVQIYGSYTDMVPVIAKLADMTLSEASTEVNWRMEAQADDKTYVRGCKKIGDWSVIITNREIFSDKKWWEEQ